MKTITAIICITILQVAALAMGHDAQLTTAAIAAISALGAYQVGSRRARAAAAAKPPPEPPFHENC